MKVKVKMEGGWERDIGCIVWMLVLDTLSRSLSVIDSDITATIVRLFRERLLHFEEGIIRARCS